MSAILCSGCGGYIDTDDEPEAYVEIGNMRAQTRTVCMCRICRERHEEQAECEPRKMPPDWKPTPEQQAVMDAPDEDTTP